MIRISTCPQKGQVSFDSVCTGMGKFLSGVIHDTVDVPHASASLRVLCGTLAGALLFRRQNLLQNGAVAGVFQDVSPDVVFGVLEAVTDKRFHPFPPGFEVFAAKILSFLKLARLSRMGHSPSRLPHSSTRACRADFIFSRSAILAFISAILSLARSRISSQLVCVPK
jgi:hypothetical protein